MHKKSLSLSLPESCLKYRTFWDGVRVSGRAVRIDAIFWTSLMPNFAISQIVSASGDSASAWGTPSLWLRSRAWRDLYASVAVRLAEVVDCKRASASCKSAGNFLFLLLAAIASSTKSSPRQYACARAFPRHNYFHSLSMRVLRTSSPRCRTAGTVETSFTNFQMANASKFTWIVTSGMQYTAGSVNSIRCLVNGWLTEL